MQLLVQLLKRVHGIGFVLEFIALFAIKNKEIEFAIARGAGFHMELSWYATHFPMNLVFAVTALLAIAAALLFIYGLYLPRKPARAGRKRRSPL